MPKYIRHVVGPMVDLIQHCVICGEVIADYRGAMVHPAPTGPIQGWAEGNLFISVATNPTTFKTEAWPPPPEDVVDCAPSKSGYDKFVEDNDDLAL